MQIEINYDWTMVIYDVIRGETVADYLNAVSILVGIIAEYQSENRHVYDDWKNRDFCQKVESIAFALEQAQRINEDCGMDKIRSLMGQKQIPYFFMQLIRLLDIDGFKFTSGNNESFISVLRIHGIRVVEA